MTRKKRGNYNQDYFKVGGSPQPGDDIVHERQKQRLTEQKKEQKPPKETREGAEPEEG